MTWDSYTGASGATGPTAQAQAQSLLIEGSDVELVTNDGGLSATASYSMTQCGGVIVASNTCGGGTSPSYFEVLSASSTSLVLYDGATATSYSSSVASPDGGTSSVASLDGGTLDQDGAACATDQTVCGGLPNDDWNGSASETTSTSPMQTTGNGTSLPYEDEYAGTAVTLYNQAVGSTSQHTQRVAMEFTPGVGVDGGVANTGSFRLAIARDEAFSTRVTGTFSVNDVGGTMTLTPACPSDKLAATIAYDSTSSCDLTLYLPASFLSISGSDEAVALECD